MNPGSSAAQIRYAIPEELPRGASVGNIAKDLGTDVAKLEAANLQVLSDADSQYFSVNVNTGVIAVSDRIDREQLCRQSSRCFLHLRLALNSPAEFYRIEVEVLDINDNPPAFPSAQVALQVYELASLGARFPVPEAQDPDVGSNALQSYHLSASENFHLNVKARADGSKFPELVLDRALDREHRALHQLVLTAADGGSPPRSSQTRVLVQVLDANDNRPVFEQPAYRARVAENSPPGTLVLRLKATDVDEGPSGEVRYALSSHNSEASRAVFAIDARSGELRVRGPVDFEEAAVYEVEVAASDRGSPPMEEHCSVTVEVTDVNDNAPELVVTSLASALPEDAPPGTVVAVIHVADRDSEERGRVRCHVPGGLPFRLRQDSEQQYTLLTSRALDRESVSHYNLTVSARDLGSPPLARHSPLAIALADVNDNAPRFPRAAYEAAVAENNPAGQLLLTVSATDPDLAQNARLAYALLRGPGAGAAADPSAFVSVEASSGQVSAKLPLDHESTPYLQFQVQVSDGGSPALSSRALVHLFVTDQNDNAPWIQLPGSARGSALQVRIPRSTRPRALVTKVVAVDADSGRNAWLAYQLVQATEPGLFGVALRSGEIRTTRALQQQDAATQELVLLVKDAGEPPRSASVRVLVQLEGTGPAALLGSRAPGADGRRLPSLTLCLIAALAAVSTLALAGLAALGVRWVRGGARAVLGSCVDAGASRPLPGPLPRPVQCQPRLGDALIDVPVTPTVPSARGYRSCFSPGSDISEFVFMKPCASLGRGAAGGTEVSSPREGQRPRVTQAWRTGWRRARTRRRGRDPAPVPPRPPTRCSALPRHWPPRRSCAPSPRVSAGRGRRGEWRGRGRGTAAGGGTVTCQHPSLPASRAALAAERSRAEPSRAERRRSPAFPAPAAAPAGEAGWGGEGRPAQRIAAWPGAGVRAGRGGCCCCCSELACGCRPRLARRRATPCQRAASRAPLWATWPRTWGWRCRACRPAASGWWARAAAGTSS
ncbi:protocadherin beta-15-like [Carettochelys insculpta]|uniref:protocadherin beta-15-like n=1 Tax=Carettochelys insculpta TaxID=44489 RepID=UPI003EBF2AE9